jgi:GTPase SAR1 family protein
MILTLLYGAIQEDKQPPVLLMCKFLVLGSSFVGKSALLLRLFEDSFTSISTLHTQ